jgi:serine/threonine-protein kinase HipA
MSFSGHLFVFNSNQTLLGRLSATGEMIQFKYSKSYLASSNALAINPIYLPLSPKTFFSNKGLSGMLMSFLDSKPGVWGECVLNACYGKKLTDFELLLENQSDRVGYLVYNTEMSFPDLINSSIKAPFLWEDILDAKEQFEKTNQLDDRAAELFKQGASQGGARPKLSVIKDGVMHLAKLPTIRDYVNVSQIEHGTLALARAVGITTVKSELISLAQGRDIFLTERFDYLQGDPYQKSPYLSMMSVLGVQYSAEASYPDFALELKRLNGGLDSNELFRRMVFNVLVSNHDDHYQNHAIYFKEGLWRLTPAFDVVAGEGVRRSQAICVGSKGNEPSRENLLSRAGDFNLDKDQARDILENMIDVIEHKWKAIFREQGVSDEVIQSVSWAILRDVKPA